MIIIPKATWWQNWRKAILLGIVLLVGIGAIFYSILMHIFTSSYAYREALLRVQNDQAIVASLGSPIESGYMILGEVNSTGPAGHAALEIPIRGPNGRGTIYVEANEHLGVWKLTGLIVEINQSGRRMDLLATDSR